jgi:hypothetical protein
MSKLDFILKTVSVKVDDLVPAPWNYKTHGDPETMKRFVESIRQGMTAIHVAQMDEDPDNESYEVCDGNHRLEAIYKLIEEGESILTLPVYNHGRLTLNQRKAIAIRYNEWRFESNLTDLVQCLSDIQDEMPEFEDSSPYSEDEVERLIASLDEDNVIPSDGHKRKPSGEYGATATCPDCGTEFEL